MTTFGSRPQQPDNTNKHPLAKPPRQLPKLQQLQIMMHGSFFQVGFAFFSMGLFSAIFFYTLFLKTEYLNNNGKWIDAPAVLTDIEKRSNKNSSSSFYYYYAIEIEGKKSERSSTTKSPINKNIGDTVMVQYHSIHTNESDIIGMRADVPAFMVYIVMVFPIIGLIIFSIALLKNRKMLHLYQFGEFTWGRLLSSKETNVRINKQTQYLCEFEFVAHDSKTYKTKAKTITPHLLEDEEDELILYRRENPDYNIVYDASPAAPIILPDGSLQARYFFIDHIGLIIFLLSLIGDIFILFSPLV
jgi:hypothetical protein